MIVTVYGNINQGSSIFSRSQSLQCTFIAFTALYFTFLYGPNYLISSDAIDHILHAGDSAYERFLLRRGESPRLVGHYEIPSVFGLANSPVSVLHHHYFRGSLLEFTNYQNIYGFVSLRFALTNSFCMSNFLLGTFGASTISIIRSGNVYLVFDSHGTFNGVCQTPAFVQTFCDLENLMEYIVGHFSTNTEFEITPFSLNYIAPDLDSYELQEFIRFPSISIEREEYAQFYSPFAPGINPQVNIPGNDITYSEQVRPELNNDLNSIPERNSQEINMTIESVISNVNLNPSFYFEDNDLISSDHIPELNHDMNSIPERNSQEINMTIESVISNVNLNPSFDFEDNDLISSDHIPELNHDMNPIITKKSEFQSKKRKICEDRLRHINLTIDHVADNINSISSFEDNQFFNVASNDFINSDNFSVLNHDINPKITKKSDSQTRKRKIREDRLRHINLTIDHVADNINSIFRFHAEDRNISNYEKRKMKMKMKININSSVSNVIDDDVINHETEKCDSDLRKFYSRINELPIFHCACCLRFLSSEQTVSAGFLVCGNSFNLDILVDNVLCRNCEKYLKLNVLPGRSFVNNLQLDDVPGCISELNFVEKRFLSKVQTFMTLLVLSGGQYAEKGLAIHFPCDIDKQYEILPTITNNCPILCHSGSVSQYIDKSKIRAALNWLKFHNSLYSSVAVNMTELYDDANDDLRYNPTDCFVESGTTTIDFTPNVTLPEIRTTPINLSNNTEAEALAYPWHFPYGNKNTFCSNRLSKNSIQKLSLLGYYQSRFLHTDNRFRHDISYLIAATNHFEKIRAGELIGICTKMYRTDNSNLEVPLMASDVKNGMNSNIRSNSYSFLHGIRGTAAYWRNELFSLLARFKRLGPPDLFLTLSANDGWPDLINILIHDNCGNSENLRNNPVIAAMHFERRWSNFLKSIILGKGKPLGEITDYWARIEFQNRGSPHVHAFFWVKDAPSIWKGNSFSEVKKFIDSVSSTCIPHNDGKLAFFVKKFQTHHHTFSCSGKRQHCRFCFPRPVLAETNIFVNERGEVRFINNKFYESQRATGDEYINAYSPKLLPIWQANMDIQVVGGSFGLANYVCNYVCKAEPDTLRFALKQVYDELRMSDITDTRRALWKIAMVVLKERQMSAQEAAFRICHLPLIYSSRQIIKLSTCRPNKRIRLLKKPRELHELEDESSEIFQESVVDYYYRRPATIENVCLYYFASWYKVDPASKQNKIIAVTKRNKFACIRTPQFSPTSEDYFYHLLLLYYPHRGECDILCGGLTPTEAFTKLYSQIDLDLLRNEECVTEIINSASRLRVLGLIASNSFRNNDIIPGDSNEPDDFVFGSIVDCSERLRSDLMALTNCQRFAFDYINTCLTNKEQFKVYLFGEAGTGKSHLLRVMSEFFRQIYRFEVQNADPVVLCAPTGVAAINILGTTVHSLLKLPVQHGSLPLYSELSPMNLKNLRYYFKHKKVLIVDEVSMVSSTMLNHMHRRLCSIFQNNDFFGGMNVIFCGDFFQLRPCRGNYAFCNNFIWDQLQPLFLKINKRQEKDTHFAELLTRARVGKLSSADIVALSARVLNPAKARELTHRLHLYPTRIQIKEFNSDRQSELRGEVVSSVSVDTCSCSDHASGCLVPEYLIPDDDRDAGGLHHTFSFCIGTRVMLLRNMYLESRLVNGAMGYIRSFTRDQYGRLKKIQVIFDDIDQECPLLTSEGLINIDVITIDYAYKGRYISRTQFPLAQSWACTVHKAQGLSLDAVVADVGSKIFEAGQAYVAISRARTLDGLHLIQFCPKRFYASDKVMENELKMIEKFNVLQNS